MVSCGAAAGRAALGPGKPAGDGAVCGGCEEPEADDEPAQGLLQKHPV